MHEWHAWHIPRSNAGPCVQQYDEQMAQKRQAQPPAAGTATLATSMAKAIVANVVQRAEGSRRPTSPRGRSLPFNPTALSAEALQSSVLYSSVNSGAAAARVPSAAAQRAVSVSPIASCSDLSARASGLVHVFSADGEGLLEGSAWRADAGASVHSHHITVSSAELVCEAPVRERGRKRGTSARHAASPRPSRERTNAPQAPPVRPYATCMHVRDAARSRKSRAAAPGASARRE
jgi:hypothetical protein